MAHSSALKLCLAALACAAASTSSLAGADAPGDETFSGTCEMSGTIRHQPGMTNEPAFVRFHGHFEGVCSGQLTDRHGRTQTLDAAPAEYDGRGSGQLGCLAGLSTGTGKLTFARGGAIEFRLTERRAPGVAFVTLEGEAGGTGTVVGTVSREEDLQEIGRLCGGPGLRVLRGDARIASPGISG